MSHFIVQFPLVTETWQENILDKRFEIGRKIYNALVQITQNRYSEMIKTKKYRLAKAELSELYSSDKNNSGRKTELLKSLNELYKQYGLNEYSFHDDVKNMQKHFKQNIDSFTAQKIATNLWKAYEKLLFGEGEYIHYKKFGALNSLEGKSNKAGIRFRDGKIVWNGLKMPVKIDDNNDYEQQAMQGEIAYCRIVRKFIKGKCKYYIQLVFKGNPPIKTKKNNETGNSIVHGDVGLDIGMQTIAISSQTDVKIYELADKVQDIENKKTGY